MRTHNEDPLLIAVLGAATPISLLCRKAACASTHSLLYWKISQGFKDWLDHKSLTSCIKRKVAKILILLKCTVTLQACQPPMITPFPRFSWLCPCWQTSGMVPHGLQSIHILLSGPHPFQSRVVPVLPHITYKLLAATRTQGFFPPPSAWNILPLFSELTASLSCKTQLNCPLLQETNYFFHWVCTAHHHGSQCLHTCLCSSFTKSPWGVDSNTSNKIQRYTSSLRRQ